LDWKIILNGSTGNVVGAVKAASLGGRILEKGSSALDAVEASIAMMEDDPKFDAGTGCDINVFGLIMMDASIMDGKELRTGAVGAVRGVKNPIRVARKLMEHTNHVLLVGEGAEEFAKTMAKTEPSVIASYDARTEDKKRKLREKLGAIIDEDLVKDLLLEPEGTPMTLFKLIENGRLSSLQQKLASLSQFGTVSASALDKDGNFAAGASTGGWTLSLPGRIGDSPLAGCGAYADNSSGCSSTAGIRGEENVRLGGLTRRVCDLMEKGLSAQRAVDSVTAYAFDKIGLTLKKGSLISIDNNGEIGYNFQQKAAAQSLALMEEGMEKPLAPLKTR
jgi:beta-aspartyl-peptidase (threonine type)